MKKLVNDEMRSYIRENRRLLAVNDSISKEMEDPVLDSIMTGAGWAGQYSVLDSAFFFQEIIQIPMIS